MLLLVDLDNTLSDRAGSLEAWARSYPAERSRRVDEQLLAEIIQIDGDGLRPKNEVAADRAGCSLDGAWMIGDAAESDIAGAAAGIDSVWLRRRRSYPAGFPRPTLVVDSFAEAVDLVIARA